MLELTYVDFATSDDREEEPEGVPEAEVPGVGGNRRAGVPEPLGHVFASQPCVTWAGDPATLSLLCKISCFCVQSVVGLSELCCSLCRTLLDIPEELRVKRANNLLALL